MNVPSLTAKQPLSTAEHCPPGLTPTAEAQCVPARPRLAASERRAQLIETAQPLFAEHGYHHISMDDVAQAAHVTKPVLYKHFPSKFELYCALLDDCGSALVETVTTALGHIHPTLSADSCETFATTAIAEPCAHAVRTVIESFVNFAQDCGVTALLLFESDVSRDAAVRARLRAPQQRISHELASIVLAHTELNRDHAESYASFVVGCAVQAAIETLNMPTHSAPTHCVTTSATNTDTSRINHFTTLAWHGVGGHFAAGPSRG